MALKNSTITKYHCSVLIVALTSIVSIIMSGINVNTHTYSNVSGSVALKNVDISTLDYNNTCDLNLSNILFGAHHKTGTVLLNWWFRIYIDGYFHNKCDNYTMKINYEHCLEYRMITNFISNKLNNKNKNRSKMDHISIINIVRNPIDSILSGYNYHLFADEHWLQMSLLEVVNSNRKIIQFKKEKSHMDYSYNLKKLCYGDIILKLVNSAKDINKTMSIQQIYLALDIHIGIYFEYERYIKCEYNYDIYPSYIGIKELKYHKYNEYIHGYNIKLEHFKTDYSASCDHLLNLMGIQNKKDKHLLTQRLELSNSDHRIRSQREHFTDGTFNKTKQIEILLNHNINQCLYLKNITVLLDYQWKYSEYC